MALFSHESAGKQNKKLTLELGRALGFPFMIARRHAVAYHVKLSLVFMRDKLAGDIFAGTVYVFNVLVKHTAETPVKIIVCKLYIL